MSGRTQFWLGSLMLALAIGLLVGGAIVPGPGYAAQPPGEGRSMNFAVVPSDLPGTRARSQLIYIIDDRNEALYMIEASSTRTSGSRMLDYVDLRKLGEALQKKRAEDEKRSARRGVR